eukprot:4340642-Amphidinium_carterae.1
MENSINPGGTRTSRATKPGVQGQNTSTKYTKPLNIEDRNHIVDIMHCCCLGLFPKSLHQTVWALVDSRPHVQLPSVAHSDCTLPTMAIDSSDNGRC